jgi:NAD(P)-dependent dehydrogenase (short-subunit alcohol dehydrogenase family)
MDLQLRGKRALVTGGSRGIGRAIARRLAEEGCGVVIAARDPARLESAAAALASETGSKVAGLVVDTSDSASVKALVEQTVQALGGLDILVNGAAQVGGQTAPPKLAELTEDAFWNDVDVKVLGYLRVAQAAAPHMIAAGWGRIINISGLAARQASSLVGSMRNVAVAAATKNLADELGPHGINVTVVHPGVTLTETVAANFARQAAARGVSVEAVQREAAERISIGRIVTPEQVADVVAFLASPRSVAINGDAIAVGGGPKGPIHY